MSTTAKVTVTDNLRDLGEGRRRRWQVRWKVDGCPEKTAAFPTRKAAAAHQARLIAAVTSGELFDRDTREPVSWGAANRGPNTAEWVRDWVAREWTSWAPTSRRSAVEAVAAWLPALGSRQVGDRATVYAAVKTVLNPTETPTRVQVDVWRRVVAAARPVGALTRDHILAGRAACDTKLDGTPASANYRKRRRAMLGQVLEELVAADLLEANPLAGVREKRAKSATVKVDAAEVGEPDQVLRALAWLAAHKPFGWVVLFAFMFYAGLRPSEAVAVRWRDLVDLPATGWGLLRLTASAAEAGSAYTDNGEARQERGLKWRAENETRPVPLPPELVALVLQHQPDVVDPDALVVPGRAGRPMSSTEVQRVWARARREALPGVDRRCLHRPYSLRHSAASLWLGLGVSAAVVAARLGHSVATLLATYADVLDSHAEAANDRIGEALEDAAARVAAAQEDVAPVDEVAALRARLAELEAQLGEVAS